MLLADTRSAAVARSRSVFPLKFCHLALRSVEYLRSQLAPLAADNSRYRLFLKRGVLVSFSEVLEVVCDYHGNMVLTLSYAEHDGHLLDVFNEYYEKGSYMDVRFVCRGNKVAFAHKLVVASVSPLLRRLVSEAPCRDEVLTLHLPDVGCGILGLFLTFLYEGVMKLDVFELAEFKELCNLLCVDIPNAEICQVPRESVSPPAAAPSLAQRMHKISSSQRLGPRVLLSKVEPRTTQQTLGPNVSVARCPAAALKQETGDEATEAANLAANASQVQVKKEPPEVIRISPDPAPEEADRNRQTGKSRHPTLSNKPPDIAGSAAAPPPAEDGASTLAITNVVSLSGGGGEEKGNNGGLKRTRTIPNAAAAKPSKQARRCVPWQEEESKKKKGKW